MMKIPEDFFSDTIAFLEKRYEDISDLDLFTDYIDSEEGEKDLIIFSEVYRLFKEESEDIIGEDYASTKDANNWLTLILKQINYIAEAKELFFIEEGINKFIYWINLLINFEKKYPEFKRNQPQCRRLSRKAKKNIESNAQAISDSYLSITPINEEEYQYWLDSVLSVCSLRSSLDDKDTKAG